MEGGQGEGEGIELDVVCRLTPIDWHDRMAQRRRSLVSRIRYTAYNPDHMAIYISHLNQKKIPEIQG